MNQRKRCFEKYKYIGTNSGRLYKIEKFAKSPPLPPNLIRIMEGADVLERMGSYLDALRSMDSSNVQDVVGAFEALPAGYGRHLEMKLLMRSWSAIDPESALKYAKEKLDEKSERRFGISEAWQVGQKKTQMLHWHGQMQIITIILLKITHILGVIKDAEMTLKPQIVY